VRYQTGAFVLDDPNEANPLDRALVADRVDAQFLELLAAFNAQGRDVSHNTGRSYAPALFAKDPGARGTTSKGFEAAMNRLFASGRIRVARKGSPSRQISYLEAVPE